ncbi:hypothetical protein Trydic_g7936 [Trypoxylus dichotomus]
MLLLLSFSIPILISNVIAEEQGSGNFSASSQLNNDKNSNVLKDILNNTITPHPKNTSLNNDNETRSSDADCDEELIYYIGPSNEPGTRRKQRFKRNIRYVHRSAQTDRNKHSSRRRRLHNKERTASLPTLTKNRRQYSRYSADYGFTPNRSHKQKARYLSARKARKLRERQSSDFLEKYQKYRRNPDESHKSSTLVKKTDENSKVNHAQTLKDNHTAKYALKNPTRKQKKENRITKNFNSKLAQNDDHTSLKVNVTEDFNRSRKGKEEKELITVIGKLETSSGTRITVQDPNTTQTNSRSNQQRQLKARNRKALQKKGYWKSKGLYQQRKYTDSYKQNQKRLDKGYVFQGKPTKANEILDDRIFKFPSRIELSGEKYLNIYGDKFRKPNKVILNVAANGIHENTSHKKLSKNGTITISRRFHNESVSHSTFNDIKNVTAGKLHDKSKKHLMHQGLSNLQYQKPAVIKFENVTEYNTTDVSHTQSINNGKLQGFNEKIMKTVHKSYTLTEISSTDDILADDLQDLVDPKLLE